MRKFIIAAAITCSFATSAMAHYYNETFDCGRGQTVWVANPVEGHGEERKRKIVFEIKLSDYDFEANSIIRSPVVRWDVDKDEVTLDGRPCRLLTDDEAEKVGHPDPGGDK
jgi:hypothetical protein